jgi:alanyl-tRNA synthetase
MVNDKVLDDEPVAASFMALEEARKIPGVRAVFGEKYPDPVRVLTIGASDAPTAVEFCGGTHLQRTGQIGLFKIVYEESVAKGVRRITAVTGHAAVAWAQQADSVLRELAGGLKIPTQQLPERIAAMQQEIKQLRKKPAAASGGAFDAKHTLETAQGKVLVGELPGGAPAGMRNLCDQLRQRGAVAAMVGTAGDGKVTLIAMVKDDLAKSGKLKAGDWVKQAAAVVGGGGGGKPTLAQAGGKQPEKLPEALSEAARIADEALK